jgi:nicotinic acid mononucleotide adenylyltransferase
LVYVPAGRSPFKTTQPISDHHRIAMLELALRDVPDSELWTQEIDDARLNSGQASYWADTWAIVRRMRLGGTNRFLIGSDQALSMHQWRRYEEFWADAVVMLRDGADTPKALIEALRTLGVWDEDALAHWQESIVVAEMIDASSSSIRAALTGELTRNAAIDGLDDRVHRYILDHGLYPIRADAVP